MKAIFHWLISALALVLAGGAAAPSIASQWESSGPPAPANSVVVSPVDPQVETLYAGSAGGGVFVSRDAAAHWQPFNEGLPPQTRDGEAIGIIWNLAITPGKHGYLYAANYGKPCGIYRRRL